MKRFIQYFFSHLTRLAALLLCAACFALVFYLSDLPLNAVGYAFTLSLSIVLILIIVDFTRFVIHMNHLERHELPPTRDPMLWGYQNRIRELETQLRKLHSLYEQQQTDATDYYTLWMHQIKTPISAMRLSLTPEDKLLSQELFKIEQYVEMALTYSRLSSDATDFVFASVPIDRVIKHALRKYADIFIAKKLSLEYEPSDLTIVTDEKWLQFVIEQLLSNALKYTIRGRITISVDAETLHIQDTGIGIAPEDLPRVFEKGFTGYNGRSFQKATGLGLYLCKRVCEKLAHPLSISSVVGKGTTVSISLKRVDLLDS